MYKIIIFGTGASSKLVMSAINEFCEVVAYVDNNVEAWGIKNGICVNSPSEIKNMQYDFIIIASQYNDEIYNQLISLNVDMQKIMQFYKVFDEQYNYVTSSLQLFKESKEKHAMLVTGISYCYLGFRIDVIKKKCAKFAFGSQDLYYDYNIVKYILKNYEEQCKNIEYCVIALNYYSFQYDMSLSAMKNKVSLYYEAIGLCHHNYDVINKSDDYNISKGIADKIFAVRKDGNFDYKYIPKLLVDYPNRDQLGRIQAERDCNKDYPQTVKENINILIDYLDLLNRHSIKPIVVVFPASQYYTKYFSERIENEFHNIIENISKEHKFQYLDYFKSNKFDDSDFEDVSHLSYEGAKKFTQLLNENIEW